MISRVAAAGLCLLTSLLLLPTLAAAEEDLFAKAGVARILAGSEHQLTTGFSGPRVTLRMVRDGDDEHVRVWVGPDATAAALAIELDDGSVEVLQCAVYLDPGAEDRQNLTNDIESRCPLPNRYIDQMKSSRWAKVQVRFADGSQMRQAKKLIGPRYRAVTTLQEVDPGGDGLRPPVRGRQW